jgi:hypothetical protein
LSKGLSLSVLTGIGLQPNIDKRQREVGILDESIHTLSRPKMDAEYRGVNDQ